MTGLRPSLATLLPLPRHLPALLPPPLMQYFHTELTPGAQIGQLRHVTALALAVARPPHSAVFERSCLPPQL